MSGEAALKLAQAAAQTEWSALPDTVRDQAVALFLDTLAVSAAGLSHETYAPLVKALAQETGCATISGLAHGVPVNTAIQINGGATTVLQLQDGHRMGRGHPASHMMPALLALAEETDASADSILGAFVAGYEVGARIGIALGGLDPALHDTGTWTTIATAVAAVHMLTGGKNEAVIAAVIEASAAVALMPYRDLPVAGATAHHLYIGIGATTAVMAARAVIAGQTALPGTLETFFGPRTGAAFNPAQLTDGLNYDGGWSTYEIERAYIKVHPTCAHLHGANDAVLALLRQHDFRSEDISTVEIATYEAGLAFDNPAPENDLAARFSLTATTAIALHNGRLDNSTLTAAALDDPAVKNLMSRTRVIHDPDLDADYPGGRPTRITITLNDGQRLENKVVHPLGDHTHPLPADALRQKAIQLLNVRFKDGDVETILSAFDAYVAGAPIKVFSAALRRPARS